MHPDIENLMNMALADGEITEKERSILLRKAEALGEDIDEVEMILEGKLSLLKKQSSKPANSPESAGNIIKCPQCKANIPSFSTNCEFCGHEFRNLSVSNSVKQFFEKLEALDNNQTSGNVFESFMNKLGDDKHKRKIELILNFPVPNSKEDILEFLALSVPRARPLSAWSSNQLDRELTKAYAQKCEQIIMKAGFSFKNDNATLEEIRYYANELKIKMR
jgi:hypothetical protein